MVLEKSTSACVIKKGSRISAHSEFQESVCKSVFQTVPYNQSLKKLADMKRHDNYSLGLDKCLMNNSHCLHDSALHSTWLTMLMCSRGVCNLPRVQELEDSLKIFQLKDIQIPIIPLQNLNSFACNPLNSTSPSPKLIELIAQSSQKLLPCLPLHSSPVSLIHFRFNQTTYFKCLSYLRNLKEIKDLHINCSNAYHLFFSQHISLKYNFLSLRRAFYSGSSPIELLIMSKGIRCECQSVFPVTGLCALMTSY